MKFIYFPLDSVISFRLWFNGTQFNRIRIANGKRCRNSEWDMHLFHQFRIAIVFLSRMWCSNSCLMRSDLTAGMPIHNIIFCSIFTLYSLFSVIFYLVCAFNDIYTSWDGVRFRYRADYQRHHVSSVVNILRSSQLVQYVGYTSLIVCGSRHKYMRAAHTHTSCVRFPH